MTLIPTHLEDLTMDRPNENVELFRAFEAEELEARLQNGYYGYGDEYYGCCPFLD